MNQVVYSRKDVHPEAKNALNFGALALISSLVCCCFGFFAIIPVVFGGLALSSAAKADREILEYPDRWHTQSASNARTGRNMGWAGLIIGGIGFITGMLILAIKTAFMFS